MANQRVGGGGRGTGKSGSGGVRGGGKSGPRQPGSMKAGGPSRGAVSGGSKYGSPKSGFGGPRTGASTGSGRPVAGGGRGRTTGASSDWKPRAPRPEGGDWKPRAPRPENRGQMHNDKKYGGQHGRGRDNRPGPQGTGYDTEKSGWDTRPDRARKFSKPEDTGASYSGKSDRPKTAGYDRPTRPGSRPGYQGPRSTGRPESGGYDKPSRPGSRPGYEGPSRPSGGYDRPARPGSRPGYEGPSRPGGRPESGGHARPERPYRDEQPRPKKAYRDNEDEPVGKRVQAAFVDAEFPSEDEVVAGLKPVLELLSAGSRPISSLMLDMEKGGKLFEQIIEQARRVGVKVKVVPKIALDKVAGPVRHQGAVAVVSPKEYEDPDEMVDRALASGKPPIIIILDGIEDPHNLGAVIRTAEAAGADGIVIPERNAAHLSAAVARASAGALEHMPVARVPNLSNFIEKIKVKGIWVVGLAGDSKTDYTSFDMTGPVAVVMGNEGSGIRPIVRQNCDGLVSLPMMGKVSSLNVSVAAGIVVYEALRQRKAGEKAGK